MTLSPDFCWQRARTEDLFASRWPRNCVVLRPRV